MTFTSLDVMLHTEALLSAINFLSTALSSGGGVPSPEKEVRPKTEDKTVSAKSSQYHPHTQCASDLKLSVMCYFSPAAALVSPVDSQVTDLKVVMDLGAFNVLVCDQLCNMADIKIQGTESELNFVFCEFSLPNLM